MNQYDQLSQLTRQGLSMSPEDRLKGQECHFELEQLLEKYGDVGLHALKFMACYKTIQAEEKATTANQAPTT